MLKWQENFLAGESVKDPEKIKKKLNSMGFSDDDLSHIDKSIIDDIRFCFS